MLLHDSSYPLILKTLRDEEEKVNFFMQKEEKRVLKDFERRACMALPFPYVYHTVYQMPASKNTYLCWFKVSNKIDLARKICIGDAALILNDNKGKFSVYGISSYASPDGGKSPFLYIYTAHFFSRYRERFRWGGSLSTNDLIARFFSRNSRYQFVLDFGKMNLNAEQYKDGSAFQIPDGIAFATAKTIQDDNDKNCDVIRFNTFIGFDQLKDEQSESVYTMDDYKELLAEEVKAILSKNKKLYETFFQKSPLESQ